MTHPYAELEDLDVWRTLDREIATLEGNRDVALSTGREYVVGALAKRLVDEGLVVARKPAEAAAPGRVNEGGSVTAAVILRIAGTLLLLPSLAGLILQGVVLSNANMLRASTHWYLPLVGILVYLIPGVLLLQFAKPLGRLVARGL